MQDTNSVRETRLATPVRVAAAAAAAAAALTASLALAGHYGSSPLAAARLGSRVALMAGGLTQPDSPIPCSGPEYCNVG